MSSIGLFITSTPSNIPTLTITAPDATTTYSGYIFVEGS